MLSPRALPVMRCPACGLSAVPQVLAGPVAHLVQAVCAACGGFIKSVPRALVSAILKEESPVVASINRVTLLGTIGKYGTTVKYALNGTPCASFVLVITEQGQDGKAHLTFVECECWGKKAEAAGAIVAGTLVLFEGKLRKRQKGEQWEMIASGYDVTPVLAPAPVEAHGTA